MRNAPPASAFLFATHSKEEGKTMKRTLMTLALVAAAGTAGAQTVTTPPVGGATVTPPSVGSGSVTTPPVAAPAVNTPAVPSRSVGAGGAAVTTPPVSGATVMPPSAGSAGVTTPGVNPPGVSTRASNSRRSACPARPMRRRCPTPRLGQRPRQDRGRRLQERRRAWTAVPDGKWHGTAMRGSAEVDVTGRRARQRLGPVVAAA